MTLLARLLAVREYYYFRCAVIISIRSKRGGVMIRQRTAS